MDRRNAAQEAQRHIQVLAGDRRHPGDQGRWGIVHIDQNPDPRALVQPARDLRYVGSWIPIAEKRFEVRVALFGKYLAMAIFVEAIDHDTVIAREVAKDPRGFVTQRP